MGVEQQAFNAELGARLREARLTLGLSQQKVADTIGIPRTAVSEVESGRRGVPALELRRLATLYRRPLGWLVGEVEPDLNVELSAAVEALSPDDREQVLRFAQYLATARPARRTRRGDRPDEVTAVRAQLEETHDGR